MLFRRGLIWCPWGRGGRRRVMVPGEGAGAGVEVDEAEEAIVDVEEVEGSGVGE